MAPGESGTSHIEYRLRDSLVIKTDKLFYIINFDDIVYIQSSGNNAQIFTSGENYHCKSTLKSILERLDESIFYQVHKSIIVNIDYVDKISESDRGHLEVTLSNREKLKMCGNLKHLLEDAV